jgi:branched-chain amino acid transport system ATP-binding protein
LSTALLADGVTAGYGQVPVIRELAARAEAGQVVGILGPNGSGKSTLMKALTGQLRLDAGAVSVSGKDITGLPPHLIARSGVGYVPQVANVFPSLTVLENLDMGGFTRRTGLKERMDEVLEVFPDLKSARVKRAGTLSGGQRNLLGMARALMLDPTIVLLDEPTAGLSPAYTQIVWGQVRRIAARGAAVIVVEQNVDLALEGADWIYLLVDGRNHLEGTPSEVRAHDISAIFLGGHGVSADPNSNGPRKGQ